MLCHLYVVWNQLKNVEVWCLDDALIDQLIGVESSLQWNWRECITCWYHPMRCYIQWEVGPYIRTSQLIGTVGKLKILSRFGYRYSNSNLELHGKRTDFSPFCSGCNQIHREPIRVLHGIIILGPCIGNRCRQDLSGQSAALILLIGYILWTLWRSGGKTRCRSPSVSGLYG